MAIWRVRIACRITKATNTHSKYGIIIAFPLQQWLHKRASMLRYTYIAGFCLLCKQYLMASSLQAVHIKWVRLHLYAWNVQKTQITNSIRNTHSGVSVIS